MSDDKPLEDIIDVEPQIISDTPPPPKRGNWRRLFATGLAIGIAFAALGGWIYRDVLSSYLPNDQMQALAARVDALDASNKEMGKRVDAVIALTDELKAKLGAAQAAADKSAKQNTESATLIDSTVASVAQLKQALDDEKAAVDALQGKLASAAGSSGAADPALAGRIDTLEKSLAALQGTPAMAKLDLGALKQAVDTLKAQVAAGQSYHDVLGVVQKLLPAAEGYDVLALDAGQGLPNAEQLSKELAGLAQNLPKPAPQAAGESGWMDRIGGWLSNLVTITPTGGDDAATQVAKAVAFAASGDLQQATDALAKPGMVLPSGVEMWRDKAQRRLKLEQAVEKISAAAAREIAAKG